METRKSGYYRDRYTQSNMPQDLRQEVYPDQNQALKSTSSHLPPSTQVLLTPVGGMPHTSMAVLEYQR
jgi:hypothetical protein